MGRTIELSAEQRAGYLRASISEMPEEQQAQFYTSGKAIDSFPFHLTSPTLSKEVLPNGQVRYRHIPRDGALGVWVSAERAYDLGWVIIRSRKGPTPPPPSDLERRAAPSAA